MTRREFITLLGGAAAAWSRGAGAQRSKPTLMGLMGSGAAATQSELTSAFVQRLRELGWSEGRNLTIEYRWAEGRSERFAEIAAEFVRLKVDVIVTHNTLPPLAARQATSVIPIVFATAGDPVGTGIVESLARPGGNVTGLSSQHPDTAGKRLEMLRELVPGLRRLAVLLEPGNPFSALELDGVGTAARTLGVEVSPFEIRRAGEIASAFESIRSRAQAVYVFPNPVLFVNRIRINILAAGARLPTMYSVREYVDAGGLLSYGPNWPHMWSRAAGLVDKILRVAKPADLPTEQTTKFDLVINLTAAQALSLDVPSTLLARADEVIE